MERTDMAATALAKLSKARQALIEAKTLNEVLDVCDVAAAVRAYVKAAGESLEIQNTASDLRLSAERKAGELLATMEKNEGGRPSKTGDTMSPVCLDDLGITKKQSSRWQLVAKLPGEEYAEIVSQCNASGKELTQAVVLRAARIYVFGEDEKPTATKTTNPVNENLVDLIAMARRSVADLAEAFGESNKITLIAVLKDEIENMEASL